MNDPTSAKSYVNPPNLLTAGSLTAGFVVLLLASQGQLIWAAGTMFIPALLDSLDGLVARKMSCDGPFGSQLDSLADLTSFGVAPAFMLYVGVLNSIPVAGVGACLAFVLAGAWRLARFPLIEEPHRFIGLPIPPAGVIAAGMAAWAPPAGVVLALTLAMSALMVSEVPFPTIRAIARLARPRPRRRPVHPVEVEEATLVRK